MYERVIDRYHTGIYKTNLLFFLACLLARARA